MAPIAALDTIKDTSGLTNQQIRWIIIAVVIFASIVVSCTIAGICLYLYRQTRVKQFLYVNFGVGRDPLWDLPSPFIYTTPAARLAQIAALNRPTPPSPLRTPRTRSEKSGSIEWFASNRSPSESTRLIPTGSPRVYRGKPEYAYGTPGVELYPKKEVVVKFKEPEEGYEEYFVKVPGMPVISR